jgi:hypothetical protein
MWSTRPSGLLFAARAGRREYGNSLAAEGEQDSWRGIETTLRKRPV